MIWAMIQRPNSPTDSPYFTSGLAIAGTLASGFIRGRVQHGFLRALEVPIRQPDETPATPRAAQGVLSLNSRWRNVLRISSVKEKPSHPMVNLAYLLCALVAAAVVTVFTPELGEQTISYDPRVPGRDYPKRGYLELEQELVWPCAGVSDVELSENYTLMEWQLSNGGTLWARYNGNRSENCAPDLVVPMATKIQNGNRRDYAYVDSGVAIQQSALGASTYLFRGDAPQNLVRGHGGFMQSTRQCVPVLAKNPVSCRKSNGTLVPDGEKSLLLDLNPDQDYQRSRNFSHDTSVSSSMLNVLRLKSFEIGSESESEYPGLAYAIYSARNSPDGGQGDWANILAGAMGDPDAGTKGNDTYIALCKIDARDSFEYREVTLDFQVNSTENFNLGYTRLLRGGEKCKPEHESVGYLHFVGASSAQRKFAFEGMGVDGFFWALEPILTNRNHDSFAFNNSQNELEDALGIIAAMGVSVIDLDNGPVGGASVDRPAEAIITVLRLGKQNKLAYIWILPLVILLILICYNTVMSWSVRRQPGAGLFNSKRPELYAAESIIELMSLDRRSGLQTEEHSLVERSY
ncbi:hypothetical protein CC79DRAFT_1394835 [Sarocladium strictum]